MIEDDGQEDTDPEQQDSKRRRLTYFLSLIEK